MTFYNYGGGDKDLILVTDKISDVNVLDTYLSEIKDRVMVEAFSLQDYYDIKRRGYKLSMRTGIIHGEEIINCLYSLKLNMIQAIATDKGSYLNLPKTSFCKRYVKLFNIPVAIFSATNINEADSIFSLDKHIKFVYVDNVTRQEKQ